MSDILTLQVGAGGERRDDITARLTAAGLDVTGARQQRSVTIVYLHGAPPSDVRKRCQNAGYRLLVSGVDQITGRAYLRVQRLNGEDGGT